MRRSRRKNRPVAEINVVPYIDVMMVLLVIFIATAPVVMQGVTVDLPQAESKALSEDTRTPFVCSVDALGNFYIDNGEYERSVRNLEDVTENVRRHLALHPDTPVVVQGDAKTPYNNVIQLMNALKMAGVDNVGLVTQPIDIKPGNR